MDIELTTTPSPEDAAALLKRLVDYNNAQNPELQKELSTKLFLFVRNTTKDIIGGLRASFTGTHYILKLYGWMTRTENRG